MNKTALYAVVCIVIIVVSAAVAATYYLPSNSPSSSPSPEANPTGTTQPTTQQVTDMAGRTVTVSNSVTKIIGLNYGALRLITYMQASDLVCGVEQTELTNTGRTYAMAHPEYQSITVIGPQFGGDPELIAAQNPDVVFITDQTKENLDSLQSQIGAPVIGIVYGELDTAESRQTFYDSLTLMGKILHNEPRAIEVINYVSGIIDDLNTRTATIAEADKPIVYIGGLSSRGTHGFSSTSASYAPFTLTNSNNVITLEMANNSTQVVNVDVEALPSLNPDVIFVDYAGFALCKDDVQNHIDVYGQLDAIQDGRTYGVMSYNNYALNFDVALSDAYYVGTVLYPTQFADINPQQKADEIYTFLCGAPLYDQMVSNYGPFEPVSLT
jgi:iron complex transport system substrate-binding protein